MRGPKLRERQGDGNRSQIPETCHTRHYARWGLHQILVNTALLDMLIRVKNNREDKEAYSKGQAMQVKVAVENSNTYNSV